MKQFIFTVLVVALLGFVLWAGFNGFANGGRAMAEGRHEKVNLCHWDNGKREYSVKSVDDNSIVHKEHGTCKTDGHGKHESDIIPGFTTYEGCTFTAQGDQAVLANDCKPLPPPPPPTCEELENCPTPPPVVTATPTPTPGQPGNPPTFAGSSTEAPQCGEANVPQGAENVHVYRKGDDAIVKWLPTGGNEAIVYYKQVSAADWQYAVKGANIGYVVIHGLGSLDISFAVQQVNGCSGGVSVMSKVIVDGASNGWVLFR